MNNIGELVEIIMNLGGEASFDEICRAYQNIHIGPLFSNDKSIILNTLKNNNNLVFCDKNEIWKVVKNKKINNNDIKKLNNNGVIRVSGNWSIIFRDYTSPMYKKLIRRDDKKIDIVFKDGEYRIFSSSKIKDFKLLRISNAKVEPRPYVYLADRRTIIRYFPDIEHSFLDWIEDK